tara:strand:+ start:320 stop:457 length:138 start_codon:yes stop_codon:yes gene_type:complete
MYIVRNKDEYIECNTLTECNKFIAEKEITEPKIYVQVVAFKSEVA